MKINSQFTINKEEKLMTPEAERFNGWTDIESKKVAEKLNGRLAMLGIIAGLGAYLTTGQIIPGFV